MDKIDGPYYFFKLIAARPQRPAAVVPERRDRGPEDQHRAGRLRRQGDGPHRPHRRPRRPGLPPDRPVPAERGPGDQRLREAAHAPEAAMRIDSRMFDFIPKQVRSGLTMLPPVKRITDQVLADLGIPRSVLVYINYPTDFDSTKTQTALEGTGISVPPLDELRRQALGLLGAQPRPRPLQGPLAVGRRSAGKVVLITGALVRASAGRRAIKCGGGRAPRCCSSPARRRSSRRRRRRSRRRGHRPHPPVRPLRPRRLRAHGEGGPRRARAGRHPRQQRRPLDPALGRALLRPLPRLRAHHAAQLLRRAAADPRPPAGDAEAQQGPQGRPHHQHQLDRRADQYAALLGLCGLQGGARRLVALRRLRGRSTTASISRRSTCRWCGRR